MKNYILSICLMALIWVSCKKENQNTTLIKIPEVSKVTPAIGQSGDTIVIEGTNFNELIGETGVAINGIPAQVITVTPNQIKAIIPAFTLSGNLRVTVNNSSVNGPPITIIPTPGIKNILPDYGFAGDTLTITGEHFASNKADNHIILNGVKTLVVVQQADTLLKVIVPSTDGNGVLLLSTFNGKQKTATQKFVLRKAYSGNIMDYIAQDPGFSYTNAIMQRMKEIYPEFYHRVDSVWSSDQPHTVFLRDNNALRKQNKNFTSVTYVRNNADPQSFFYNFLWITTKGGLTENQLENQDYLSELTEEDTYGGPGNGGNPDLFFPITVMHGNNQTFVSLFYSDPVKITKANLKATNGVIHQVE